MPTPPEPAEDLVAEPYAPHLDDPPPHPFRYRTNLILFIVTVFSVFLAGASYAGTFTGEPGLRAWLRGLWGGYSYAIPLLSILLFHEFGHYFAARYHRVDASLPYFIPFPLLSPFGTMGAVISMRGRIKSRNALLDIGAAGPLAGLVVAIPVLIFGLLGSPVREVTSPSIQEGQSLLYIAMKRILLGPIPDGQDVFLNPIAFAGWTGIFVTMLNMLPVAQLDGGHIAYALFGLRQNKYSRIFHVSLLGIFALNLARFLIPALKSPDGSAIGVAISNSTFWLVWYALLFLVKRVGGQDHPPTEPGELSPLRKVISVFSLILFVLLFMPTPWATH